MNRRQVITAASLAAIAPKISRTDSALAGLPAAAGGGFLHVFYGGNGTVSVDSGLPRVGTIYGIDSNGDLRWYRYSGQGEQDPSGSKGWDPNSGNRVGNGWQNFLFVMGCGDGVILAINPDGDLLWYQYDGDGEDDPSGSIGWHPNSGNPIGNGWQNFLHVFVTPREGRFSSSRLTVYAVADDGDLRWYAYDGNGESDISGASGWLPNSGNTVGNGWQNFRQITGIGGDIFAVHDNGDLLWYSYAGDGEADRSGANGWRPNSGNPIGNGWQGMRHVFGGSDDANDFHQVVYAVDSSGDLHWYAYEGNGEADRSGNQGWRANSGNTIGNGW
jgi:hypothetical protein